MVTIHSARIVTEGRLIAGGARSALRPADFRGFALDAAARAIVREYNRRLRPYGLSYVPYFVLLVCCADASGRRPSDIAAELHLDGSSLSGHLDRLEAMGFVQRRPDADDRRVIRVESTEAGRALVAMLEPIGRALADLEPDLDADALGRVERAVQATAAGTAASAPEPQRTSRARAGISTTLRLVTLTVPRSTVGRVLVRFAALVEERSGGSIRIALELPSTAKGGELQTLVDLRSGDVALASITAPVYGNLVPDAQLIELPYLLDDVAHADAFLDGEFGTRVLADAQGFGLTGLGFAVNGFRWLTTRDVPAREPRALSGQRLRVQQSPINVHLAEAWRAAAVPLPFGKLADALAAGEIDAQENALANIAGLELWRSQGFLVDTRHAISAHVLLANSEILAALGAGAAIVASAMRDAIAAARRDAPALEAGLRDDLARRMALVALDDAERARFEAASLLVHDRMSRAVGEPAVARAVALAHSASPQPALV
jgi:TRAP-type C4-dicarboxylate transport system substrate-binding protein/DNA-binding MarR family transcriptional regulator